MHTFGQCQPNMRMDREMFYETAIKRTPSKIVTMLYALAMPSSSSPCGDGARNAKRVLGKKVCAQEGPSNFDLAQFCQKKRKIEKEEKQTLLSFVRKRRRTRGDKLCAQERLDPTLALLNSATAGTASYINTAIILQF